MIAPWDGRPCLHRNSQYKKDKLWQRNRWFCQAHMTKVSHTIILWAIWWLKLF